MKNPANIFAYTFGIIGALIFGTGMYLAMEVIASGTWAMVGGVVVGLVGLALCFVTYPIYNKILEKGKSKYGSDIIRLAKEITDKEE